LSSCEANGFVRCVQGIRKLANVLFEGAALLQTILPTSFLSISRALPSTLFALSAYLFLLVVESCGRDDGRTRKRRKASSKRVKG